MNNAELLAENPYDAPPSWWRRHAGPLGAVGVFIATVVLSVVSFPPHAIPEAGYAFAAPALFWAYRRPAFRLYAWVVLGAHALAWTIILSWLHHVTWAGLLLLGPFTGVWVGVWFLAAHWVMPRLLGRPTLVRISAIFGLAALWVLNEWLRTWLLSGFPWLPLSASQWQRLSVLQIASYTGAGGVSFVLIAMNLGFAAYGHRLLCEGKRGLQRRSQEFFACMFLLVVCLSVYVQETFSRGRFAVGLGKVAFVQPYIPQAVKWDPSHGPEILGILEKYTLQAGAMRPDLILWPEASTPWAVRDDGEIRRWTEALVGRAKAPLLLGSVAVDRSGGKEEAWSNGAFLVDPIRGVQSESYAKRHLVPFGEYVPFRPILGWLEKFVPIGGDFQPGSGPSPLLFALKDAPVSVGPLICYEDIFPSLARASVLDGADLLVVLTNNAWFGEGGAAYQHAAHSVLRAIETRRPVLRVGNGGWSGWIDEFGAVRALMTDPEKGVYFRGVRAVEVTRDFRWIGQMSVYVRYGDWFIGVCAALAAYGWLVLRFAPPPEGVGEA
ncbi:MAG: apolipoprotein N-acyltransferase [Opitutaceae bacterium]